MFEVGSTVVYRNRVCVVADICENYFEGRDYYELHAIFERALKFYVAISEANAPTVRPVMTQQEALRFIEGLPALEVIDEAELGILEPGLTRSLAERRIKDEYTRRLSQCSPRDLAVVVKSAYRRSCERELAGWQPMPTDKKFLALAEKLLCDEISASLDMPREDVPDFLYGRLSCDEFQDGGL